jgi:uncharacterized surface protein with fasciclin (FAS1) repeats
MTGLLTSLRNAATALLFASGLGLTCAAPASAERFLIALNDSNQQAQMPKDVIDAAAETGQFHLFLSAVETAGMEDTLRGDGPFTLFAPTDAAFTPRDQAQLQRLMRPAAHDELIAFVSYHVVPERVSRETLHGRSMRMQSAGGHNLSLDARDGLRVNDQLVVAPDIEAGNGYVQGMNAVLYPPVLLSQR